MVVVQRWMVDALIARFPTWMQTTWVRLPKQYAIGGVCVSGTVAEVTELLGLIRQINS